MRDLHASKNDLAGRLELRHLRLVRAVAAEGTVTRAAGCLHLSQSAVSHQLVDLERDLGARLFDRVGKRMIATPAGARILASAERLAGEIATLERDLEALRADVKTQLRVTTSCFTSYNWLPAALTHFAARHPKVELTIVLEATRRATAALLADEVDLAIVTDPPREDGWEHVDLLVSELVALASPKHPVVARGAGARKTLRWADLRDVPILVYDIMDSDLARLDAAVRASFQRETGERWTKPLEVRKIPLTDALVELARAGSGIGIVDRWTVAPHLGRRDLVGLSMVPRATRTFRAVWRRSNPRALPMHDLVAVIRDASAKVRGCKSKSS